MSVQTGKAHLPLALLDHYEGHGGKTRDSEFVRPRMTVALYDGGEVQAWVYCYNRPVERLLRIRSGDFLNPRPRSSC